MSSDDDDEVPMAIPKPPDPAADAGADGVLPDPARSEPVPVTLVTGSAQHAVVAALQAMC